MEVSFGMSVGNRSQEIFDVGEVEELPSKVEQKGKRWAIQEVCQHPKKWPCKGFFVIFPEGRNHQILYLFGIHNEQSIPWNYRDLNHNHVPEMDQIEQLCMLKLNGSHKLLVKVGALDEHKQWVLAVASGQVEHVAPLVQAGLKHWVGIKTLIQQYEGTVEKLYKPKGYIHEDIMWSIVFIHLGGACVAQFAYLSLALPSLSTIRHQTALPALVISPSIPCVVEVKFNIISCCSSSNSVSVTCSGGHTLNSDLWGPSDKQTTRLRVYIKSLCWMS